jgi:ABC-type transport system involved in multi-copper enzyme maturation permease subunit
MDAASPARLYATVVGAALVVVGIVGFFYSASFGSPGAVDQVLGAFAVNGWDNVLHVVTGTIGLLAADYASRRYSLGIGLFYLVLAFWGFSLGSGEAILGFLPVNTGDNLLHLAVGALGILAARATPVAKTAPATA